MRNPLVIPLLVAASVAFASSSSGHKQPTQKTPVDPAQRSAALASSLAVNVADGVHFKLNVRNNSPRMVELRFPNGKTHDFFVLDESGREVWRWSNGRMFTQALQNKLIKSKDNAVFADSWSASNAHGKFTAVAVLASVNHPVEERVEFALR
jgi:hypothetical protein